jgi:predicted nuclease of restriction endonuclease-like (RecB) superfamily
MQNEVTFPRLIDSIRTAHHELAAQAGKAVNISLTLRNWLIGYYIAEYELNGKDRAVYGDRLLVEIAQSLIDVQNCNRRQLYDYLRLYRTYPQIVRSLSAQFQRYIPQYVLSTDPIVPTASAQSAFPVDKLFQQLSYNHLKMLVELDDVTKRAFSEIECIRGNWSVREMKRQMGSLYYERSGLSLNKKKLSELTQQRSEEQAALNIRDPYIFEFLGLKPAEVMSESHLEQQLTDKLQEFLLELGYGFCFEARQKRMLIGGEHFFVDLVFYHRILKCHVLVELKLEEFSHENLGQLNTYVSWYREHMMTEGDYPPVGILLCTDKNHALVEYALAGMDNQLFVSKYQLELPKKEEMQRFIDAQIREAGK